MERVRRRVGSQVPQESVDAGTLASPCVTAPQTSAAPPVLRDGVLNVRWRGDMLKVFERETVDGEIRVTMRTVPSRVFCDMPQSSWSPALERELANSPKVKGIFPTVDWIRVEWFERDQCIAACEEFAKRGIDTREGDVSPTRRWLTDGVPTLADHRVCFLDIETDSRIPFSQKENMRILTWCVQNHDGSAVHRGILTEDTDVAERLLLNELFVALDAYDLVCAWNGDRFDFSVVVARVSLHRMMNIDFDRWLWLDQLECFRRMNTGASESGEEKQSYALQAIATALLGEGKDDFDASKTWQAWDAGGAERQRLSDYNVKDVTLQVRIEQKTGFVKLLCTLCELCNVFPDSFGMNPTVQAEGFLLLLAAQHGYKFPSAPARQLHKPFKGAYVMEPACSGIQYNVHVADFASLYPSIIASWNMSPETRVEAKAAGCVDAPGYSWAPLTDVPFRKDTDGMLSLAVREVMRLRKQWNDLKATLPPGTAEWTDANRKSTAYKIAANCFFGIVGSPVSRFFDPLVGESITQAGKWLILETIKAAERYGMRDIYADTDSLFVANCTRYQFEEFVRWCNSDLYPQLLQQKQAPHNLIKLAYEKEFERVIFSSAKKYVGRYVHFKGALATLDSKPEVKGMEYKRGDAIRLARQMQAEIVDLLVGQVNGGCEDPARFEAVLMQWQTKIMHDKLELADVLISKRLSKEIGGYAKRIKTDGTESRQLPHIEVAKVLRERGRDVAEGAKIDYFIYEAGTHYKGTEYKPAEDWTGHVDRYEVWDKLVAPASLRLLQAAFPAHDWSAYEKTRPTKRSKPRAKPMPVAAPPVQTPIPKPIQLRTRRKKVSP